MSDQAPVSERRTPAHVEAYLPGGLTKLLLHIGDRVPLNVPTSELPTDARQLGSRVVVVYRLREGEERQFVRVGIEKDKGRLLDA